MPSAEIGRRLYSRGGKIPILPYGIQRQDWNLAATVACRNLARAEFDDKLLVEFFVFVEAWIDIAFARNASQSAFRRLGADDFEKVGDRLHVSLLVESDLGNAARPSLDRDLVARFKDKAGYVAMLAIEVYMPVRDQLPGGCTRRRETQSMHNIIKSAFEEAQESFEVQLDAFTPAKLADWIDMTSHG